MLLVKIGCSGCPEEIEVMVDEIEDVERIACLCSYGYVVLAVSEAIAA